MEIYTVDEVAKRLGISRQTLVRYEKKGVLPKARRNRINNWREYTDKDIRKMMRLLGRGYTVIEMVMVIVIVGILAALAIPRFQTFYAVKLSGAMKKVVLDIRYTQQLAVSEHTNTKLVFNAAADTYTAQKLNPVTSTWVNITDPFTRGNLNVNFTNDLQYRGIDIFSTNLSSSTLRFNWQGIPQEGPDGSPPADLIVERSIAFRYRNNNLTVYITPNTGRVRVQ